MYLKSKYDVKISIQPELDRLGRNVELLHKKYRGNICKVLCLNNNLGGYFIKGKKDT